MARIFRKHSSERTTKKKRGQSGRIAAARQEVSDDPTSQYSVAYEPESEASELEADTKGPLADHLSSYFRDMSEYELLAPEQEKQMAEEIERREIETWALLLGNPTLTEHLLDLLETRVEEPIAGIAGVRKAVKRLRKARTRSARQDFETTARAFAATVRAADLDRVHVDAVLAHLEELHIDSPETQDTKLPFSTKSRTFTQCLRDARENDKRATRLRDDFVRANLRLVVTMARRYDHGGMPLPDLIQEGNLGLMHAVSRFDHRRGLRFSTYACWWIRHAIGRAMADKARTVRIPVHMLEAQSQLQKIQQELHSQLGRKPTATELARASNMSVGKIEQMHRYLMGQPMSLDRPVHDNDDRAFGDVIPDPESEEITPEDRLTALALVDRVERFIAQLSPIEADVIRQRFGLREYDERTFREIGDQYELSRERIRQIQNTALGKLREALMATL